MMSDRNGLITEIVSPSDPLVELNFKLSIPNQLFFDLKKFNSDLLSVTLKKIILGGLELTPTILGQICNYTPLNLNKSIITTTWQEGKVNIDFFAEDWVQYHLLYGNKIII
jgi:hypothetical protein